MKIKSQMISALLCMSALTMGGCKVRRPADVIAEDKMERIIYDYHIAKAMGYNLSYEDNYKRQLYLDAVFRKHGVSEAEFDSSLVWYTRNTGELDDIYTHVAERLKSEQQSIDDILAVRDKKNLSSVGGDTVDVWAWHRVIALADAPISNLFTFAIEADTNYHVNDMLVWTADVLLAGQTSRKEAPKLSLQLVYDNDSIVEKSRTMVRSGRSEIRLGDDKIGRLKAVNGFVYRPVSGKDKADIVLSNIQLMRYHTNDTVIAAADTLKAELQLNADSVKTVAEPLKESAEKGERLSPELMNKRRTNMQRVERPEQIEVENKIQQERLQNEKNSKNSKNGKRRRPAATR